MAKKAKKKKEPEIEPSEAEAWEEEELEGKPTVEEERPKDIIDTDLEGEKIIG